MKQYIQAVRTYLAEPAKKELLIRLAIILGAVLAVIIIVLLMMNRGPKFVYQPSLACNLLTGSKASEMLGAKVLHNTPPDPVLTGNVVTSKCSYTDANPQTDNMLVAAIAVRSGINDEGVKQNKAEFEASKAGRDVEIVNDLGDGAYFNHNLGQLNVLNGRDWLILSYGTGTAPETNSLDRAVELAQKALAPEPKLPTF